MPYGSAEGGSRVREGARRGRSERERFSYFAGINDERPTTLRPASAPDALRLFVAASQLWTRACAVGPGQH